MQSSTKQSHAFVPPSANHYHRTQLLTNVDSSMKHSPPPSFGSETGDAPSPPRHSSPASSNGSAREDSGFVSSGEEGGGGRAGTPATVEELPPAGLVPVGLQPAAATGQDPPRLVWVPLPLHMKRKYAVRRTNTGDTAKARISRADPRLLGRRGVRVADANKRSQYISFPDIEQQSEVDESDDGDDDCAKEASESPAGLLQRLMRILASLVWGRETTGCCIYGGEQVREDRYQELHCKRCLVKIRERWRAVVLGG